LDSLEPGLQPAALAYAQLASGYLDQGDTKKACSTALQAIDHLADLQNSDEGNRDRVLMWACSLTSQLLDHRDGAAAEQLAQASLDNARASDRPMTRGCLYVNASTVTAYRGKTDLAVAQARSAIDFMAQAGGDKQVAISRANFAWLLIRCDPPRLDEAEHEIRLARATKAANQASLLSCDQSEARIALLRGDAAAAARIATAAISVVETTRIATANMLRQVDGLRVILGAAQILAGDVTAGTAAATGAAERMEASSTLRDAAEAWQDIANALTARGLQEEADTARRRAALADSKFFDPSLHM
jgi:hypothetical protein